MLVNTSNGTCYYKSKTRSKTKYKVRKKEVDTTISFDEILKSKIQWFIDNPDKLPQMSVNAEKVAQNYTWEKYYTGIGNVFEEINDDIL